MGCFSCKILGTITREELQQMDQRTTKLMTMSQASYPRDDIDRLYVSREEGRGLTNMNIASIHQYDNSKTT